MQHFKGVEKQADGFVAYPIGTKGVVIGQGDSYEEALTDVVSAIRFHIETFGTDSLASDLPESAVVVNRIDHIAGLHQVPALRCSPPGVSGRAHLE